MQPTHSPDNYDTDVETVFLDDGSVEFTAYSRNPHGTGFDLVVSNPMPGRVDMEIFQVVGNEVPREPSVSLSLTTEAAHYFLSALQAGFTVAMHQAKLKKYH